ncbi:PucR family transcriptional regulator ligand-binding domain-containing protein [Microbacterium sp. VKM Ac-2923]|uniref:PucR family transcriptional regulator n=1 Tax=Microbacterium sp. VKM Ac-2923 TaxID=2929476 RepID=UPI001FB2DCE2|nr:PucR family transcriptional regulator ligand-binding domain-containing protein [Microbacterium sp. VKM Ac-2923]MCJ1707667.1 PucR family transcriptional regulator ligand-binding domain-containing protein [Microbacterium sp. VKM Ac-2923]
MVADTVVPPSLRALLARRDLHLRLVIDEGDLAPGGLDRPVRWVHSSDLADPTPFLSEGLVLLTTGTQFADATAADYTAYVGRLLARGVRALGFGTEVVRDGIPSSLVEACAAARMPLFEVPYRTPFIAVARAGAEAIAADAYARRSWSLAAQRAVSLAALRPDGLSATLAELSRQLDCWVGLFDAAGSLRDAHPAGTLAPAAVDAVAAEVTAMLRRGTRAAGAVRVDDVAVTVQTLGRGGHLRGALAIAADDLDHEARSVVTAVVAMAALALEQQDGLGRAIGTFRAGLVQSLSGDDPALARRAARDLLGPLPSAPVIVALTPAASARSTALSEWLERRAHERRGDLFFGRGDDGLVLVVPAGARDLLSEVADRFETVVGCSTPTGYDGFSRALEQARTARDRVPTPGVADFADTARAGLIAALSSHAARTVAAGALAPLRRHDAEQGSALIETLDAWLANDCSHEATAHALGIHRHTVRARMALAERVVERDLSSFAARAELWAALRLAE